MSFRIMDLMVDVMPARCAGETAERGCPNSGGGPTGKNREGCPNSGGHTVTCPPETEEGCPNSGGPLTGKSPERRRAQAWSAAALPDLRRQLRETLSAQA
jgi:hypothetical protein